MGTTSILSMCPLLSLSNISKILLATFLAPWQSISPELTRWVGSCTVKGEILGCTGSMLLLKLKRRMLLRRLARAKYQFRVIKQVGTGFPQESYYLLNDQGGKASFWNDIPLQLEGDEVTCCVEIPKERIAKMEVIKELKHHPIMQDTRQNFFNKEQELRYYAQFPIFNYGFLPQTWESILVKTSEGWYGDNDPVDIVEIGTNQRRSIGSIFRAKVLGAFCLIDQGEVDWKVVLLDSEEAREKGIKELGDLPESKQIMEEVKRWFKQIKTFDGKAENFISFDDKVFSKDETLALIRETHEHWTGLGSKAELQYSSLRGTFHF